MANSKAVEDLILMLDMGLSKLSIEEQEKVLEAGKRLLEWRKTVKATLAKK